MSGTSELITIKELADSLNLPKSKISYQVSKLDSDLIIKKGGINYIKKEGQSLIKEAFKSELSVVMPHDENSKREIKLLKEQLESKDSQITQLHRLLDQQQQLTLQSNHQIETLQMQLVESVENAHPAIDISKFRESLEDQHEEIEQLKLTLEEKREENQILKHELELTNEESKKKWWQRIFN